MTFRKLHIQTVYYFHTIFTKTIFRFLRQKKNNYIGQIPHIFFLKKTYNTVKKITFFSILKSKNYNN